VADRSSRNPSPRFSAISESALRGALDELGAECAHPSRAYELRETAAGWQLVTKPQFSPWLRQLFPEFRSARLSAPAMETLAIIAYRQPITRADIEAIRGVAVDGVLQTLLDRGLVKISGRAEVPGRPLLYDTTQNFMDHFGLRNLDELPNVMELRKVRLPMAASTATAASSETPSAPKAVETSPEIALQNAPPEDKSS
jgi:segregation and condensation protein B